LLATTNRPARSLTEPELAGDEGAHRAVQLGWQ
jgi:hypothetical protein